MSGKAKSPPSHPRPVPKSKVIWSDDEKDRIVKRAVDLKRERPSLNGLALLRASLEVLPANRRRQLIAISQAPWFPKLVAGELKRREMETRLKDDTAVVLREQTDHQEEWRNLHQEWRTDQLEKFDKILDTIGRAVETFESYRQADVKLADQRAHWEHQVVETLDQVRQSLADLVAQVARIDREVVRPLQDHAGRPNHP